MVDATRGWFGYGVDVRYLRWAGRSIDHLSSGVSMHEREGVSDSLRNILPVLHVCEEFRGTECLLSRVIPKHAWYDGYIEKYRSLLHHSLIGC